MLERGSVRILLYTNSFFPDPIGIGFYNTEWAEALRLLGHDVEILTAMPYYPQWEIRPPYRGRWYLKETLNGIRVTRTHVFVPRQQSALKRFLCEVSFMLTSLPFLFLRRNDLVIAVTPPLSVSLAAAFHRLLSRTPLWLHIQDLQVDAGEAVGFLRHAILLKGLRGLERWILKRADAVTTITAAMQSRVSEKLKGRGTVALFPNWVDVAAMQQDARPSQFRQAHGALDRFIVLYAGNVGLHQGLDNLVEAAARLQANPEIRFFVVGDGNYKSIFEKKMIARALKNVTLLPPAPKELLADMLAAADVGIVMETRKMANLSMPSKVWNQMACGRPVIAVTAAGTALARMVEDTGAGIVVAPDDVEALANAVLSLQKNPSRREAMGVAARQFVCDAASKEKIFRRLPELIQKAMAQRQRSGYFLKRFLDIFLASLGFLVSSPLWVLVPLLILIDDRGPVFYKQERVGRFGKPFWMYKFRSMNKMELPQYDRRQARRGDVRITRVGALLRRTAMDEVPQLWNILKGDMSFVGPRALMSSEIEVRSADGSSISLEAIDGYHARIQMRPGLTGIAQVYAARDISRRGKFRYDALYIGRQSLWLDICLLLRSGWNSLTARWEAVGRPTPSKR